MLHPEWDDISSDPVVEYADRSARARAEDADW